MPYRRHKSERLAVGVAANVHIALPKALVARIGTLGVQHTLAHKRQSLGNLESASRRIFHFHCPVYCVSHIRFGHKAFYLAC